MKIIIMAKVKDLIIKMCSVGMGDILFINILYSFTSCFYSVKTKTNTSLSNLFVFYCFLIIYCIIKKTLLCVLLS